MKPLRLLSALLGFSMIALALLPAACGDSSAHPKPVETDFDGGKDSTLPPSTESDAAIDDVSLPDLNVPDAPNDVPNADAMDAPADVDAGPPGCSNGTIDNLETDIDCGGGVCAKCIDGKMCVQTNDCAGGSCVPNDAGTGSVCITPSCTDRIKNGSEADVDCGGPTCPKCSFGKACVVPGDCVSNACAPNGFANACTCPTGMTVVATSAALGGAYCVDQTEVQNGQYNAFVNSNQPTANQIAVCSGNSSYVPQGNWPPPQPLFSYGLPVRNVDFCDAYAYCRWAGKQLCGKIGGGGYDPAGTPDAGAPPLQNDKAMSAWYNACSAQGNQKYPYDISQFNGSICNGNGQAAWEVWSYSDQGGNNNAPMNYYCQGGSVNLFQMSGNVAEWEDACTGTSGAGDICLLRGGSYAANNVPAVLACDAQRSATRLNYASADVGFRCCQY